MILAVIAMITLTVTADPSTQRKKRVVGAIAIVLVSIFAILFLVIFPDLIVFLIAALATSLTANWIFRRLDRQKL